MNNFYYLGAFVTIAVISIVIYNKRKKASSEDVLMFKIASFGLIASVNELYDDWEDGVYVGYYSNKIIEMYERKWSKEKFDYCLSTSKKQFNELEKDKQKYYAEQTKLKFKSMGFEEFGSS